MTEETKQLWPGWETVQTLGTGSFSRVYEIRRDIFGEQEKAALKVISIPRCEGEIEELQNSDYSDQEITAHFRDCLEGIVREYTIMSRMKGHKNIVRCEDLRYIQHDGGFGWDIFIKMELLTPLVKALPRSCDESTAIRLGRDICEALAFCRSKNVLHRDIKPQNIFLDENGCGKLGDFGIAKVTEATVTGTFAGSPNYMAPEVVRGEDYGATADIYSLGLVLYWVLNRRRLPFVPEKTSAEDMEQAKHRRWTGEAFPPPADCGQKLWSIVKKACAFRPEDRYQTPEEMLRDLEELEKPETPVTHRQLPGQETTRPEQPKAEPVPTPRPEPEKRPAGIPENRQPSRKNDHLVPVVIGVLIVLLAVFVGIACLAVTREEGEGLFDFLKPEDNLSYTMAVFPYEEDGTGLVWGHKSHRRRNVTAIAFCRAKDIPATAWDVSAEGDRSVMAWLEGEVLTVAAGKTIRLSSDASNLFRGYENVETIDFGGCVDTSQVTSMRNLFSGCEKLKTLDLSGFDTAAVTTMRSMFSGCGSLQELELGKWDTTCVTNMRAMFYGCASLEKLDLRHFDTSNVTDMRSMFSGCARLKTLDMRRFDTSGVTRMENLFTGCGSLRIPVTIDLKILKAFAEK